MKYTDKELEKNLFTEEEIKRVIDREYKIFERINKNYSSIDEYNNNDDNYKIIKDGEIYKLISVSDGDVTETFEDVEKFLEEEKAIHIGITNSILSKIDEEYIAARISLLNHNLQKASDEVCDEFLRLAEIDNRVTKGEEAICVGNYLYFNMGENYVAMNIHNLSRKTVKEVDYSDFVITKDIK